MCFYCQWGHFVPTVGGHGTGHPQTASHTLIQGDYLQGGVVCVVSIPGPHWEQSNIIQCLCSLCYSLRLTQRHLGHLHSRKELFTGFFWPCWKESIFNNIKNFLLFCQIFIFVSPTIWEREFCYTKIHVIYAKSALLEGKKNLFICSADSKNSLHGLILWQKCVLQDSLTVYRE